ncbi:MAG: inner membrane CreD family protein [Planctomycetota bacterium]|nr:inner membrane CreD family protein [Planctomycetota bacterium]
MSVLRFFVIILIFAVVSLAWMILGGSIWARTEMLDSSLSREMNSLIGPKVLVQPSPYWSPKPNTRRSQSGAVAPAAGTVAADIKHADRYKGLLWFSTFTVDFSASYTIPADPTLRRPRGLFAPAPKAEGFFIFPLPAGVTSYNDLTIAVNGKAVPVAAAEIAAGKISVPLERTAEQVVTVRYVTSGQEVWLYSPAEAPYSSSCRYDDVVPSGNVLSELKNFSLTVTTDFVDIDYPRGTRSPNAPAKRHKNGMSAAWQYANALTSQSMGIVMPRRTNAGPITARMSFFAPVSLFLFFIVLFVVVVRRKIALHPMHYLFIAAGFFAFHILMAYLADLVIIHVAFWIAAAVSVFLVVSYLRLVAGVKFAVFQASLAQLVYLVGFSYAFFWVGRTGLTVTIGAVVTLFILMQATGRLNWGEAFKRPDRPAPTPPPPQNS